MRNKLRLPARGLLCVLVCAGAGVVPFVSAATRQAVIKKSIGSNVNVVIRDMSEVPSEYFSGDSRYSNGECKQDHDCTKQGCNLEVCTSDENLLTTCEIGGNTPDKEHYNCGCIKDTCGWFPSNK